MSNTKKFCRDINNKVIGGVCSGIANYFNLDITLVRVLLVILVICGTIGVWAYLLLWLCMPAGNNYDRLDQ